MERAMWARELSQQLLAPLGPRWLHTQSVAGQAAHVAHVLPTAAREEVIAAAWLHDVGYAPALVSTGFHPVDGARQVRALGQEHVARLVAHHTCARFEAEERGLLDELVAFPEPPREVRDVLTYCDMTSGPSGQRVTLDERFAEIARRYGEGHLVTRSLGRARPCLQAAVANVAILLGEYRALHLS